jgi:hypothetical protein
VASVGILVYESAGRVHDGRRAEGESEASVQRVAFRGRGTAARAIRTAVRSLTRHPQGRMNDVLTR